MGLPFHPLAADGYGVGIAASPTDAMTCPHTTRNSQTGVTRK
jgi:hypothetical protein